MKPVLWPVNTRLPLSLEWAVQHKPCGSWPPRTSPSAWDSYCEHSLRDGLSLPPKWTVLNDSTPTKCPLDPVHRAYDYPGWDKLLQVGCFSFTQAFMLTFFPPICFGKFRRVPTPVMIKSVWIKVQVCVAETVGVVQGLAGWVIQAPFPGPTYHLPGEMALLTPWE